MSDLDKFPFKVSGSGNYILRGFLVDRGRGGETSIEDVQVPHNELNNALSEALERLSRKGQIKG